MTTRLGVVHSSSLGACRESRLGVLNGAATVGGVAGFVQMLLGVPWFTPTVAELNSGLGTSGYSDWVDDVLDAGSNIGKPIIVSMVVNPNFPAHSFLPVGGDSRFVNQFFNLRPGGVGTSVPIPLASLQAWFRQSIQGTIDGGGALAEVTNLHIPIEERLADFDDEIAIPISEFITWVRSLRGEIVPGTTTRVASDLVVDWDAWLPQNVMNGAEQTLFWGRALNRSD